MKKTKISGSDNLTLLLLPRFITFLFLFGGSMFLLQSPRFIFELLVLYATAAFAYLALLLIKKDSERIFLRRALFFHILLEVIIAGIMIYHSGGYSSPLILLYILSIASASMIFQIRGALSISLAASVSYIVSIYLHIEKLFWSTASSSLKAIFYEHADLFFSVSINIILFTIVALISGFVAQRLKDRGDLLKTTEEELKKAHLVTSDILDGMYSGLICIDYSREILMLNRAAKELFGWNPANQVSGTVDDVFTGGLKSLAGFLIQAITKADSLQSSEISLETDNGIKIPIAINTSPLSGSDGKPRGLIAVFHDLTEFKELQEQLRLKDQLAAVGQLSAGIAHEIRNPLTSISGSVEILRDELELNEINQRLMDIIVKESGRLERIVNEFLQYARIQRSDSRPVKVVEVLDDALDSITNSDVFRNKVRITNKLPEDCQVSADKEKLKQVLIHLLGNALESIEDDNGLISIETRFSPDGISYITTGDFNMPVRKLNDTELQELMNSGKYSHICIKDNGKGIPEEIIEKISQPFYSTRSGGTGMGLAIVHKLVDSMDGKVLFTSGVNSGSEFVIVLKNAEVANASDVNPSKSPAEFHK